MRKILEETIIPLEKIEKDKLYGFVYITEHKSLQRFYIGKKTFDKDGHWKNYLGSGKWLKRAIKKYGHKDFEKHIVAVSQTEEESCDIERTLIHKYNATFNECFYNIHEGGSGGYTMKGYTLEEKEEYRNKMSKIIKDKIKNDTEYLKRVSEGVRRVCLTEEHKEKLSKAQKKRYENPEEIKKIRLASKKVWDNYTKEQKENKMKALREYCNSKEFKDKQSKKWSGKNNPKYGTTMSEETKKMLAKARADSGKCSRKTYMYDENYVLKKVFNRRKDVLTFLGIKGHVKLMKSLKEGTLYEGYYWSDKLIDGSSTTIERVSMEKDHRE